jgi:sec-independent protein translocase protein TatA
MFGLGLGEIVFLLILGILLFGNRLPEVGRTWGRCLSEIRKGLKDLKDEIITDSSPPRTLPAKPGPRRVVPTSPKFQDDECLDAPKSAV